MLPVQASQSGHHSGQRIHPGHVSSKILKVQAVFSASVKIAAETAMKAFGRGSGLLLGVVLTPVNLIVAGVNMYDLGKNYSRKSWEERLSQGGMIAGSLFLFSAGATLLKTYFATHSIKQMMMSASMGIAKVLSGVGLFILAAVHLGKVAASIAKFRSANEVEKKDIIFDVIHNLMAATGLIILGLIMVGTLSASVASPFGWIALSLILVAVIAEVSHEVIKQRRHAKHGEPLPKGRGFLFLDEKKRAEEWVELQEVASLV